MKKIKIIKQAFSLTLLILLPYHHPAYGHPGEIDNSDTICHVCETNCELYGFEDNVEHCHQMTHTTGVPSLFLELPDMSFGNKDAEVPIEVFRYLMTPGKAVFFSPVLEDWYKRLPKNRSVSLPRDVYKELLRNKLLMEQDSWIEPVE